MWTVLAIISVLILINGFFAMSEIALLTARKRKLAHWADQGSTRAAIALRLQAQQTHLLSTVQIGITSIGILNGVFGESALAAPLSRGLNTWLTLPAAASDALATFIVVSGVTVGSIVIGELVPKRLGLINPEKIAVLVAWPMYGLSVVAHPLVWGLSHATQGILRLLRMPDRPQNRVTAEEIQALLTEGSDAGIIEPQQHHMAQHVFKLDELHLAGIMLDRQHIRYLSPGMDKTTLIEYIKTTGHDYFPLCTNGLEDCLGMIKTTDLLLHLVTQEALDLTSLCRPVLYIPEHVRALELLTYFEHTQQRIALIISEYGDIQGLITLDDLLAGINSPAVTAPLVQPTAEAVHLLGSMAIETVSEQLNISLPQADRGKYHTLGGLLYLLADKIPAPGDHLLWQGWQFDIIRMDRFRIDQVLAKPQHTRLDPKHSAQRLSELT